MSPILQHRRVLTASLVGTAVEFYDFYIYATAAALLFGPLFFPAESTAAQQMFAFMSFGVAFLARPFGAVLFGHFGDRVGRKATLVASLLLMGGSTVAIGLLPTYAQAGWLAPLLLCVLRFGQGLGLGGEWGGAALLAVENAPPGWKARFGAAPQLGAPVGFLAANGLFLILGATLSAEDFAAWGWRIPFIASAVLVAVGLWVRLRIGETAEFAQESAPPPRVPIATLLGKHGGMLFAASAGAVACFAIFYLTTAFALGYGTGPRNFSREQFLTVQLAANCFLAIGIVVSAIWADRQSAGRVLAWGGVATALIGMLFGPALASGSLGTIFLVLAGALFIMGLVYGPLGGWLSNLFPVPVRYTAISLAFTIAGVVGGALAPIAAQAIAADGAIDQVGYLLTAAGFLTLLGVILAGRRLRASAAA